MSVVYAADIDFLTRDEHPPPGARCYDGMESMPNITLECFGGCGKTQTGDWGFRGWFCHECYIKYPRAKEKWLQFFPCVGRAYYRGLLEPDCRKGEKS